MAAVSELGDYDAWKAREPEDTHPPEDESDEPSIEDLIAASSFGDPADVDVDAVMTRVCELESEERLSTLARNLATAGALCGAFRIGMDYWIAHDSPYVCDEELHVTYWHPGCGRVAPSTTTKGCGS